MPTTLENSNEVGSRVDDREEKLALAKRSDEVASERVLLEEVEGHLEADERSLQKDSAALGAERDELEKQVSEARARLAELDAAIVTREHERAAKARDLAAAREKLEQARDLARTLEREILGCREQMSVAQERLGDLVQNVLRIQHKIWRTSNESGENKR